MITAVGAAPGANSIANTQLTDMAQATFKMRAAGAGTGDPIDGTAAQAKTALAISLTTDVSGTLQAAQAPAHTGDATSTAGSLALTLATVNANVGAFGSASSVATFTANAKGLITAAANAAIAIASSAITDLATVIMTLSGTQTVTGDKTYTGAQLFQDNKFTIRDNLDTTKAVDFQLSGLTTGTTRTFSFPDLGGAPDFLMSAGNQSIAGVKTFTASPVVMTTYTVATLPANTRGKVAMVTDGSVVHAGNSGTVVAGGGANTVPVYADGTNWRIM